MENNKCNTYNCDLEIYKDNKQTSCETRKNKKTINLSKISFKYL